MYKLLNGDCLELMKTIPDDSVDAVICDPPYGTTACKWDSVIPFEPMWEQLMRITKPNAAVVMTSSQPFTTALISSNLPDFKYCMVYQKPQGVDPLMARKRPLNDIEDIVVFYRKQATYNPQKSAGKPYDVTRDKKNRVVEVVGKQFAESRTINNGDRFPTRVVKFNTERGFHPTQKPVALMEYLIKTYTNVGGTLVDFAMGSGTTGVAAMNTGRKFIGIELDLYYYAIAQHRIETAATHALMTYAVKALA